MTPEENRKNYEEQKRRKRMEKQRIRKRRQRLRLLMYAGIFVAFSLCSFLLGKSVWENLVRITEAGDRSQESKGWEGSQLPDPKSTEGEEFLNPEMTAENEKTESSDGIILVNKENPLPEDYEVELLTLPDGLNRAAEEAYDPLMDMLQAAKKEGYHLVVCSSYRDVEYQRRLFEEDVRALMYRGYTYEQAYEEVAKETMPPGYSEHSTGLAFDIVSLDYQLLDAGQEKTAENRWLQEHCAEYGFILRYPKGKEDITMINYESWHFRYVGKEAAKDIMEEGITLEEYLGKITLRTSGSGSDSRKDSE